MARSKHYDELINLTITINNKITKEEFVFPLGNSKISFLDSIGKSINDINKRSQKHKSSVYNIFDERKSIIPQVKTFSDIIDSLEIDKIEAIGLVCLIVTKSVFRDFDDS